jgi:hypothetical protein
MRVGGRRRPRAAVSEVPLPFASRPRAPSRFSPLFPQPIPSLSLPTRPLTQVDVALLARLLWLSDVGAPPLAAKALARQVSDEDDDPSCRRLPGMRRPIPPPGWDARRPHLRALDLRGCAWRPSACFRAPPLRRLLGLAPNLTCLRADGMVVAGVAGGSGKGGEAGADAPAPRPPVALDAREAALLRAAAAGHPSLATAVVDVAFVLPVAAAAAEGGAGPHAPPPLGAAADLADAVSAAGGPGPLVLGRLAVSSRPSAWWYPERPALATAAAAVGAAAGGPGGPETLELVRLSGEEAEALGVAALGRRREGEDSSSACRIRTLVITGCADGAAAWSPALAAAVGACPSLEGVAVACRAWDEADAASLAAAVGAAARAGRALTATLNGVVVRAAEPGPVAPVTPDRPAGRAAVVRVA